MARVGQAAELPELQPQGKTLAELAKELKAAITKKKKFEAQMKQYGALVHKLATGPLAKLMEDQELDFFNVPGIGALEYGIEVYPSIKKEDQEAWYGYLRKRGDGSIIVEYIHPKTLQAYVKEQLGNSVKLPAYVNAAKIPTVSIGKEKKSKKLKK